MKSFGTKYWDKSENKNPRNLLIYGDFLILAEREGFEPSKPFDLHTFQACSFDHSDTSPHFSSAVRRCLSQQNGAYSMV